MSPALPLCLSRHLGCKLTAARAVSTRVLTFTSKNKTSDASDGRRFAAV